MTFTHALKIFSFLLVFGLQCGGCGPMHMPMVVRLKQPDQEQIDQAWNKALQPIDRLNTQALLDTLLITQAYQIGVDTLSFRSEKRCAEGVVVMEIHFDRERPVEDEFTVTVLSDEGFVKRRERYLREHVEGTYEALFVEKYRLADREEKGGPLTPAERERLKELEARHSLAMSLFPQIGIEAKE